MSTAEECLIQADNYASAAMLVGGEEARALMRLAQIWRNRALRMRLERNAVLHRERDAIEVSRH